MPGHISVKERKQLLFEISFFKKLIDEQPNYVDALVPLGNAYTRLGMYNQGLEIDQQLLKLRPNDPVVWYNLACSWSLLEKITESFAALTKAIELGYQNFNYMDEDPDLGNLRKDKRYLRIKSANKQIRSS